jgi:hypothetical protein
MLRRCAGGQGDLGRLILVIDHVLLRGGEAAGGEFCGGVVVGTLRRV